MPPTCRRRSYACVRDARTFVPESRDVPRSIQSRDRRDRLATLLSDVTIVSHSRRLARRARHSLTQTLTQSQKSHNNISTCGSERAEWIIIMRVLAFARVRIDTLGRSARACTRKAIARTRTRRDMWMCPHASIARMTKASYAQCAHAQINRPGPRKARQ